MSTSATPYGPSSRITLNPEQCGGRPCIRGMRIRVSDVLELLATGLSSEQVLAELPDLETEDITAALLRGTEQCNGLSRKIYGNY